MAAGTPPVAIMLSPPRAPPYSGLSRRPSHRCQRGATMSLPNPAELLPRMASDLRAHLAERGIERTALRRHPHWRHLGRRGAAEGTGQPRAAGHPRRLLLPRRLHPERPASAGPPVGAAVRDRRPAPGAGGRRADERPHHPRRAQRTVRLRYRPASVTLVCLLDLNARELPIRPDVVGQTLSLGRDERVKLVGPAPLALERKVLSSAS